MVVDYDIDKLKDTLQAFSIATGINIQLLRDDFSSFGFKLINNDFCKSVQKCDKVRSACRNSDITLLEKCKKSKKAEMHICHAGLVDIAVPILYEDMILGYIILGQMKKETDFSEIKELLSGFSLDLQEMEKYYNSLSYFDYDKIQSVAKIAIMLTKYIMLENMLKPGFNRNVEKAVIFINENLSKNLTVEYISKSTNISKSVIYKNFHDCFNCTLSEYINRKRIDGSIEMLIGTDLSIDEISQRTGFSSAAYYAVVFKKLKGMSPLKFRKIQKNS